MNIRKIALNAIEKILYQKGYCNIVINETIEKFEFSPEEKSLFTKLVLGTVENKITLAYYLEPFLRKKQKPWVNSLLLMSIYQLVYLDIPEYAVVNESVSLANMTDRAIGSFINGVLRNFLREDVRSFDGLEDIKYLSIKYSYPTWLVSYLLKDYDFNTVTKIFEYNQQVQPTAIRVNTLLTTKEEVMNVLRQEEIEFEESELVQNGLIVHNSLIHHPLFNEGKIIIQDIASQLVGEVLAPKKDSTILDVCSAPGGKTAHLAALMENTGRIFACDVHPHKIKLMQKNFKQWKVKNVESELIDARKLGQVIKDESFDAILADLPCSGLGVMGHKVDLKYNITYDSIQEIIQLQQQILESIASLVKKGGNLIYSTCTINRLENEEQMNIFLSHHPEYEKQEERLLLPFEYHTDGFYVCKLKRKENA